MSNHNFIGLICAFLFAAAVSISHAGLTEQTQGEHAKSTDAEIGTVNFRVSCDQSVHKNFDRALGQMHHMMYEQARSEFEAIVKEDPECSMAHWGIATTLFQPLWPTRPDKETLERGWREIQKAMGLDPATRREQLLVKATAAFFQEPETVEYWDRINRWAKGMEVAYEANPDDLDTAALYALSRLALAQVAEERDPLHDEAEEILRKIWEKEPTHPGAIHYTIHATDVDGRAENALDIVQEYGKIAPEVPHALHMPTHIYVRLGDWPKVIDWNKRSADAALKYPVNGAVSHHYVHAIDYLLYAHLQQGEGDQALAAFEEVMDKDRYQASSISAFHLAAMPARLAVEQRHWDDAITLQPGTPGYLPWETAFWPLGLTWFARGIGGVQEGNIELTREAEQQLEHLRDQARAGGEKLDATYIEVDRRILAGWIAHAEGDAKKAVQLIRSATELERTVEKPPVSPGSLLPPYEALGDLLMDMDRPVEALEAYKHSDDIWPGRFNTLLGAARAANAADNEAAARQYYGQLLDIAGDSERAEVLEARRFLDE
jgi:tetratricopeptide (TPR) repeat protein